MELDLKEILFFPGAHLDFSLTMDLSHLDFYGESPIPAPVSVAGRVTNRAGALSLEAVAESVLSLCCDRCGCTFSQDQSVPLDHLLATSLEDQEQDEILLLQGGCLDIEEVATTAFILALDTKKLCSDQCLGLCATCGMDLNQGSCTCKQVSDSPFAALAQLLDQDES